MKKEILPFTKIVSEDITNTMMEQDEFGLKKYGVPLDPMDNKYDWLEMAKQELADALKYFKAEQVKKEERDKILETVIRTLNHSREEIKNKELGAVLFHAIDGAIILLEQIQEMK